MSSSRLLLLLLLLLLAYFGAATLALKPAAWSDALPGAARNPCAPKLGVHNGELCSTRPFQTKLTLQRLAVLWLRFGASKPMSMTSVSHRPSGSEAFTVPSIIDADAQS